MFSGQDLFRFQGSDPSEKSFRFLKSNFATSYQEAVQKFSSREFLKIYRKNGQVVERSFLEFSKDVEAVQNKLSVFRHSVPVLVTVEGNTYEHLVYITAGLLAGLTVSPMNPLEGPERIQQKVRQIAQPCLVAAGPEYLGPLQGLDQFEMTTMDIPPRGSSKPEGTPQRSLSAPFIYIFTSGSTGYSKIVMQSEMAVLSNVDSLIELHGLDRQIKTIATPLPVFHVNALEFSFFCSLLSGQKLILYEQFDFFKVLASLQQDSVQILSVIPQILKTLADMASKVNSAKLPLEYCVTAAASLSPALAKKLTEAFQFKIIQGYGLSEAVNFSLKIPPSLSKEKVDHWLTGFDRPSVGKAIRGNEVFVLEPETGKVLEEGQVGEICVRGHNVMLGYKDQDNQKVFAGNYLHTGDRGFFKVCPDTGEKYFFIASRLKDVIKRMGHTVSLTEIDDYLVKWCPPGIVAMAVPFVNKYSGEEIGVLCKGLTNDSQLHELKEFILREIPAFMRPRVLMSTSEKFTTESGKPKRWAFSDRFESYQEVSLGDEPLIKS